MRRRRLAVALLILIALGAAGILVLGPALARDAVRTEAEERLSTLLGQPVAIGSIGFSFVPRPAFTGSDIRVGAADRQAPAIRIDRIRLIAQWRSLFSETVRIDQIRLDGFSVSLLRDTAGKWQVPTAFPAPARTTGSRVAIDRVSVTAGRIHVFHEGNGAMRETSRIDDIAADMAIEPEGLRLAPLTGRVGGATIDGEAGTNARSIRLRFDAPVIHDADLAPLAGLLAWVRPATVRLQEPAAASVAVTIDRASSRLGGKGTLRMPAVVVDRLRLQRLDAPFTIDGTKLTFAPATFMLHGGTHGGRVTLSLDRDPARWTADSRLERINVGELLDTLAARDVGLEGTGRVEAKLQGRIEPDFVAGSEGRARVALADGVLRNFPLLATVNRALRLAEAEGSDTRFERLSATLAIAGGVASTDDLVIDAGHLTVHLAGRIGFNRTLDLRGRAIVSAERAAAAVASVRELGRLRRGGEIVLPLTIGGTLDAPRFGVDVETAIRDSLADELKRRLNRLIRR